MRIEGLHVMHCIYASHAALKYLAGRRNKSKKNLYPKNDPEIVGNESSVPAQSELAYLLL
jgi:hypothetical protein